MKRRMMIFFFLCSNGQRKLNDVLMKAVFLILLSTILSYNLLEPAILSREAIYGTTMKKSLLSCFNAIYVLNL